MSAIALPTASLATGQPASVLSRSLTICCCFGAYEIVLFWDHITDAAKLPTLAAGWGLQTEPHSTLVRCRHDGSVRIMIVSGPQAYQNGSRLSSGREKAREA